MRKVDTTVLIMVILVAISIGTLGWAFWQRSVAQSARVRENAALVFALKQSDTHNHKSICSLEKVLRTDKVASLVSSRQFLVKNPNGIPPSLDRTVILASIAQLENTIMALTDPTC